MKKVSLKMMMIAVLLLFVNCEKPNKCQAEIDEVNRLEKRKGEIVSEFRTILPIGLEELKNAYEDDNFVEEYYRYFSNVFAYAGYSTTDDSIEVHREIFLEAACDFDEGLPQDAQKVVNWADSNATYIPLIKAAKLAEEDCKKQ